jgi:hypothetical protein
MGAITRVLGLVPQMLWNATLWFGALMVVLMCLHHLLLIVMSGHLQGYSFWIIVGVAGLAESRMQSFARASSLLMQQVFHHRVIMHAPDNPSTHPSKRLGLVLERGEIYKTMMTFELGRYGTPDIWTHEWVVTLTLPTDLTGHRSHVAFGSAWWGFIWRPRHTIEVTYTPHYDAYTKLAKGTGQLDLKALRKLPLDRFIDFGLKTYETQALLTFENVSHGMSLDAALYDAMPPTVEGEVDGAGSTHIASLYA